MNLALFRSTTLVASLVLLTSCAHFEPQPLVPAETAIAYEKRSLEAPGLRAFIEKNLGHSLKKWPLNAQPNAWNLELFTLAAYYFHPSLDVARAQWQVAQAAEVSAGGRPNPTLGIQPGYNFNAGSSALSPWTPGATIDLPIETAGKRGLRIAHARQQTEIARLNLHTAAWKVRANVRDALSNYRYLGSFSALLERKLETQQQLIKLLEERQKAGALSLSEVIPARLAMEKTRLEWGLAKENYTTAKTRLAEAIGVPAPQFEFLPMSIGSYSPQLSDSQLEGRRSQALQSRADLRAALAEYDAAQVALQLEIAKQYPDVHLGTGYQWDQGESKWSFLNLSAELPVLNRNQGPITEAKAKRAEAAAKFAALQAKVRTDIDLATQVFLAARGRTFSTFAGIYEHLRQQEQAVAAQVKAGAGEQLDLLNVRLERFAVNQLADEVTYHADLATNQLEDALQQALDRLANDSAPPPSESIETAPRTK